LDVGGFAKQGIKKYSPKDPGLLELNVQNTTQSRFNILNLLAIDFFENFYKNK
jgi:hypothetical protein